MFNEYKILLDNYGYSEKSLGWNKPKHIDRFKGVLTPWIHLRKTKHINSRLWLWIRPLVRILKIKWIQMELSWYRY